MRRNYIILPLMALTGLLAACQSIQPLSIDYMLPAEASFPATLRRVAVVNNMPSAFGTGLVPADNDTLPAPDEIARKSEVHTGNAAIATEALAEALAEGNYFDQVIICDSALRAHDTVPRESTLSTEEADGLIRDLKADFLIAVEDVQLRSTTRLHYIPEIPLHYGTVDVKTYTTCRIYLPGRQGPAGTIHCLDSIYWEEPNLPADRTQAPIVPQKELIEAASDFAGASPARYLLPHWVTATRYLFTGGTVDMRDAAVYVREQNWPEAITLWKRLYDQKKGKQKIYAACNIALGYEMQDDIDNAIQWAEKAVQAAHAQAKGRIEKMDADDIDPSDLSYYVLAYRYLQELQERQKGMARLKAQMQRFEE